jgi:bile acid-coenzyme A ligase
MSASPPPAPVPVSAGRRLSFLASAHPGKVALIYAPADGPEQRLTWRELDKASNRFARLLAAHGVGERATVVIGLPNSAEHIVAWYGAWKLGATALVLRAALPAPERDALLALAAPALVVADWAGLAYPTLDATSRALAADYPDDPLPDRIPAYARALASGGSTGRPKLILTPGTFAYPPGALAALLRPWGFRPGQIQLVAGPLYHAMPFVLASSGLFEGQTLVLMDRFDAVRVVDLIARHAVQLVYLAPTMLRRIILLPDLTTPPFASIEAVISAGAPCPPALKRAWFELLGPERVYEYYGMSEGLGGATIRGDEWLAHPGSVGRPERHEVRILNPLGELMPVGTVGEIFMRPLALSGPAYEYVGAPPAQTTPDGFTTVGDLGWLDIDGYLYIADRRVDLIITGGANVYPAEVEAALAEHDAVTDSAVIGIPDEEWGRRVHAVIQPRNPAAPPGVAALDAHCRARLASYKLPKTYEFVHELPRTEAGKLRRSALIEERSTGQTPAMLPVPGH